MRQPGEPLDAIGDGGEAGEGSYSAAGTSFALWPPPRRACRNATAPQTVLSASVAPVLAIGRAFWNSLAVGRDREAADIFEAKRPYPLQGPCPSP